MWTSVMSLSLCVCVCVSSEKRVKFYNESSLLENDTLLEYTQMKTFHFNQTRSGDYTEDDIICTINLALVVSAHCSLTPAVVTSVWY